MIGVGRAEIDDIESVEIWIWWLDLGCAFTSAVTWKKLEGGPLLGFPDAIMWWEV